MKVRGMIDEASAILGDGREVETFVELADV